MDRRWFSHCAWIAAAALVALVTGCASSAPGTNGAGTVPSATATPTPEPLVIPEAALLQPADLGSGQVVTSGYSPMLSPCLPPTTTAERLVSSRLDRTVTFRYTNNREQFTNRAIPDGDAAEAILGFTPGGAALYLKELREHLTRCATVVEQTLQGPSTLQHTIVAEGFSDDESLIWQRTLLATDPFARKVTHTWLVAVVRFGDVVLVIEAQGTNIEATATTKTQAVDRKLFDRLVAAALRRAYVLRR